MICEVCGLPLVIGEFPCIGRIRPHTAGSQYVIGDEYVGGKTFEHMGHEPVTVYSKSEYQREMEKHGVRPTDRYHPNDGPNWTMAIDAQTLANAKALLERRQAPRDPAAELETLELSVHEVTL